MIIKIIMSLISNICTALLIYFSYIFLFDIFIDSLKRKSKRQYRYHVLKSNEISDLPTKEDFNNTINIREKYAYFVLVILFGIFNTWQDFLNITLIIIVFTSFVIEKIMNFPNIEFFEKGIKKQLIITLIFCIMYLLCFFYK